VAHHDNPVGRQTHVHFQAIGTGGQAAVEGRYRVFRTKGTAAAMRKHARAAGGGPKERHNAQCSMLNAQKGKTQTLSIGHSALGIEHWALSIGP
jgi:hypothetical protein